MLWKIKSLRCFSCGFYCTHAVNPYYTVTVRFRYFLQFIYERPDEFRPAFSKNTKDFRRFHEMMDKARQIATDRMIQEAERLGADAVVCFRYSTSSIMQSAAEIMAYGTAVKFK